MLGVITENQHQGNLPVGSAYTRRGAMAVEALPVRRFTASDLERMVGAGILAEDDRVELIGGRVVEMSPIGDAHVAATIRVPWLLDRRFADQIVLSVQNPVSLTPFDEPQPDVAVLRPRPGGYIPKPRAADVLLLVEVADTSLAYDLQDKAALCAAAGIAELWVLDLLYRQVVVYRAPQPAGGYGQVWAATPDETVAPAFAAHEPFAVDELLGRA